MEIIKRDGGIVLVDTIETPFVIEEAEAKVQENCDMVTKISEKMGEMEGEHLRLEAETAELISKIAAVREFMASQE